MRKPARGRTVRETHSEAPEPSSLLSAAGGWRRRSTAMQTPAPPLPSWHDTPTRRAIVAFVEAVTDSAGPSYIPPAERVAVFDNDGTLWCEQPIPIELGFILQRLAAMAD